MALVACSKCGGTVSTAATKCPHCGEGTTAPAKSAGPQPLPPPFPPVSAPPPRNRSDEQPRPRRESWEPGGEAEAGRVPGLPIGRVVAVAAAIALALVAIGVVLVPKLLQKLRDRSTASTTAIPSSQSYSAATAPLDGASRQWVECPQFMDKGNTPSNLWCGVDARSVRVGTQGLDWDGDGSEDLLVHGTYGNRAVVGVMSSRAGDVVPLWRAAPEVTGSGLPREVRVLGNPEARDSFRVAAAGINRCWSADWDEYGPGCDSASTRYVEPSGDAVLIAEDGAMSCVRGCGALVYAYRGGSAFFVAGVGASRTAVAERLTPDEAQIGGEWVRANASPALVLRAGPGRQYPRLDRLPPGTSARALRRAGLWTVVVVDPGGRTGWAATRYLSGQ